MAHDMADNTVHLHIEDTGGTGRPVILIHGWPLSAAAWDRQVPALADAGFRAIAYDRRGFGRSDKPRTGYGYDTLAGDLGSILESRDLEGAVLVGFSMGGGEVARYLARAAGRRVAGAVFAAAVPPFLMQSADNPDGPLTQAAAEKMEADLRADREAFFDDFTTKFFSAGPDLKVTEDDRQKAIALCRQSDPAAALACMQAFATTDFRDDLRRIRLPTLILHGNKDGIVPFEGSGLRTHDMIPGSEVHIIDAGPHGVNASHADEFNTTLIAFLRRL